MISLNVGNINALCHFQKLHKKAQRKVPLL